MMKGLQCDVCRVDGSVFQINTFMDVDQGLATRGGAVKQLATWGERARRKVGGFKPNGLYGWKAVLETVTPGNLKKI